MICNLTKEGKLIIKAEDELEVYALKKFIGDVFQDGKLDGSRIIIDCSLIQSNYDFEREDCINFGK